MSAASSAERSPQVPVRIAVVAAEPSGDLLASGLMAALRERLPGVRFEGIAGPLMREQQIDEWAPMDSLSVMGLFEVLQHLPRLLKLRAKVLRRWRSTPPAVFIGVDAPDFNLTLEAGLRDAGIPTVHYVSPTVWAWRTGRVRKIRRAVDLLLALFPFEQAFLARYGIQARYVGHPLAAGMPLEPDRAAARAALGLDAGVPVLALLPGSRRGEVGRLARPFVQTARALRDRLPGLRVVVPLVTAPTRALFESQLVEHAPDLDPLLVMNATRQALAAADVVLVASGTATLEAMLSKRPMVVGYKVNPATYAIAHGLKLIKTRYVALANILAEEGLAPELIQERCEPEYLLPPLQTFFRDARRREHVARRYREIHDGMRMDTNAEAADAVLDLLRGRGIV